MVDICDSHDEISEEYIVGDVVLDDLILSSSSADESRVLNSRAEFHGTSYKTLF